MKTLRLYASCNVHALRHEEHCIQETKGYTRTGDANRETLRYCLRKGRPGAVVRVVSLSHQVTGSKQPLRRFCGGGRLASVFPFPRPHSCGSLRHWDPATNLRLWDVREEPPLLLLVSAKKLLSTQVSSGGPTG